MDERALWKTVSRNQSVRPGLNVEFSFFLNQWLVIVLPRVATEDLLEEQRGTLGHVLVEFGEVELYRLDPGFSLLRIDVHEGRSATQPEE